ncbi:MAG: RNA methyltransferase [Bacteroidetes bacterium]|nr:RNA methyltransferase [Bacteroidota bacterium]
MIKAITSAQNPWLKDVVLLQEKSKFRRQLGRFTVEGLNEIRLALKSGLRLLEIAINPKRMDWESLIVSLEVHGLPIDAHQLELNDVAWSKVVVKESGQNALAVFELPKEIPVWNPADDGFYLMVESVEKPGNLGALLRSADAVGASGVVLCDERIDGFHPQVIRNSVGTTFTVPLFVMTSAQAWETIQRNDVRLYTTFMESSVSVWNSDLTGCVAMLVGTEHQGVSEFWRDKGENINIPMFGSVDSLNVSVAASLLLYEAKRQRERRVG